MYRIVTNSTYFKFNRHGAEVVEDHGAPKRGHSFGAFGGSGFKLGDSSQASEVIPSGKISSSVRVLETENSMI